MLAGGPIVYGSRKLKHVSPTGAASHVEYMAISMCCQSVVWLRQFLGELQFEELIDSPTVVYGDNEAANKLTKEDFITTGNQYIYLPYHWVKELTDIGHVTVLSKRTNLNLADCFTKPVNRGVVNKLFGCLTGHVDFEEALKDEVK